MKKHSLPKSKLPAGGFDGSGRAIKVHTAFRSKIKHTMDDGSGRKAQTFFLLNLIYRTLSGEKSETLESVL
ncbi:protein of unknown function [Streptococcus thermophilus]|uniref:Uncharacterized protein n=1 Tax=Streptococcus thermophilus TaxID=1308 RepID=A0A8D6XQC4_STRTR|nr:protein of unknown function [Streptococcus thermophilus]CAD0146657.1 protein of unknown function [Streptococcus thermophilus]CAD0149020.1 protein of unknown function [Streptococcus thermophilus]CAD0150668.1 protein of unknown function [Streptococcus thermophilus]